MSRAEDGRLTFRQAATHDVESVVALDPAAASEPRRALLMRERVAAGQCHLAVRHGRVVGFVVVTRSLFDNGFVELLWVEPASRRQGVGSQLMRHARRVCPTDKLFTSTNESNAPMRKLLGRLGWTFTGKVDHLDPGDPELFFVHVRGDS